jgi:hypothetical protein
LLKINYFKTFIPESLLLNEYGRSPGLRLVVGLLIPINRNNGIEDNNKLNSLQLRVQLKIFDF